MKTHPTHPPSLQEPTLEQFHALLGRAISHGLSREEMQRMVRTPRTCGPQLVPYGDRPPVVLEVTREKHPHEIVLNFPELALRHQVKGTPFGSPPNGELNLPPTRGFYQLCRPEYGKIPSENNHPWDVEGHLTTLGLVACDIWDLLTWYDHIGRHIDCESLPADWCVVTTTNHGFTETGHYYLSSAQFLFAVLSRNDEGKLALGFSQYPTSYCHNCWTDNAYVLGRHDVT